MAEEAKNTSTLSQEVDHSLAAELVWETEEDKKNYKIALLVAILLHIFLIWWQMPELHGQQFVEEAKQEKIMRRVVLRPPPEQQLQQLQLQKKVKKVPVPDPTPDEPEPIVPIEAEESQNLQVTDDDYIIGIPDAPPAPSGPVREGVAGLEKPQYDIRQLQANVVYPELGKKARMQGFVLLEVVLQKDGTVGSVRVIGGTLRSLGFPEAAIRAVKKLQFTPGKLRGQPVDVIMTLNVRFQLTS